MSTIADYREKVARKLTAAEKLDLAIGLDPGNEDLRRKKSMKEIEAQLVEVTKRMTENKLLYYKPYPKQLDFHAAGKEFTERLLMAANRVGKTMCGAAEIAMHLTGQYPKDWPGRRYNRPVRGWAAGVTGESTRDVVQRLLIGTKADGWGTGMIPKNCLAKDKMSLARGVSDLYDTILVKHITGGYSELKLKSYERGQEKWQGDTLDFVWFDEEPPLDIYTEGYTRIVTDQGFVIVTFTPLQGRSDVVERYLSENSPYRHVTNMTIEDAAHIPEERRAEIISGYPEHEREARARGIPVLGSGKIFDIAESKIECDPFEIPKHWSLVWGIDYGIDHPFAAALFALDRDTDTTYVAHCIKMKNATPLQHAYAMKPVLGIGDKIPVAWPHDVNQRKEFEGDLVPLRNIYKKYGLNMHTTHATHKDGGNATEIGILMMYERMVTNRFKVFKTCQPWFEEYRLYHRVDGQILKKNDDLMSASRMATMMLRIAKPVLFVNNGPNGQGRPIAMAKDIDIDLWSN